jgi:hypothetical protein
MLTDFFWISSSSGSSAWTRRSISRSLPPSPLQYIYTYIIRGDFELRVDSSVDQQESANTDALLLHEDKSTNADALLLD